MVHSFFVSFCLLSGDSRLNCRPVSQQNCFFIPAARRSHTPRVDMDLALLVSVILPPPKCTSFVSTAWWASYFSSAVAVITHRLQCTNTVKAAGLIRPPGIAEIGGAAG